MSRILPLALCLLLALGGCGLNEPVAQQATSTPIIAPTQATSPVPSALPPTASPAPPPVTPTLPLATLTAALSATVVSALPPTATAPPSDPNPYFRGIDGVNVQALTVPAGQPPLWLVSSTGEPDPDKQPHFVALYTYEGDAWRELARMNLPQIDYFDPNAVRQVQVDPRSIWLELEAGVGAHSGIYKLLRWDGSALSVAAEGTNSSPVVGRLQDLDGDGTPEVILDNTEHYVFCYACGERYFSFRVLRWDGSAMREVMLAPLDGDDKATVVVNRAVAQAQAGLWKDATVTVASLASDAPLDQGERLLAALVQLHADAFAQQVADAPFPLLDHLFYGDYDAALAPLRALDQRQLFAVPSPLITDTIAAGWEDTFTDWITSTTALLIDSPLAQQDPLRLAQAHFLRGWSLALAGRQAAALADIERAAVLAPNDKFFAQGLATLKRKT